MTIYTLFTVWIKYGVENRALFTGMYKDARHLYFAVQNGILSYGPKQLINTRMSPHISRMILIMSPHPSHLQKTTSHFRPVRAGGYQTPTASNLPVAMRESSEQFMGRSEATDNTFPLVYIEPKKVPNSCPQCLINDSFEQRKLSVRYLQRHRMSCCSLSC